MGSHPKLEALYKKAHLEAHLIASPPWEALFDIDYIMIGEVSWGNCTAHRAFVRFRLYGPCMIVPHK